MIGTTGLPVAVDPIAAVLTGAVLTGAVLTGAESTSRRTHHKSPTPASSQLKNSSGKARMYAQTALISSLLEGEFKTLY